MSDLISIIVNIYNNEKTLKNCIISLISQTYRDLEIILIDDGSTDLSGKLCDDLVLTSSKMKVVHTLHSGISKARNLGLSMASGKYITFVNGSDTIKNDMIYNLYTMISNYPVDISMCYAEAIASKPLDKETIITLNKEDALRQLLLEKTIKNTVCGKLFKRELFKSIKFAPDSPETLFNLFELSDKIACSNLPYYFNNELDNFARQDIINNDIRIMNLYPKLSIYCKYNILKNIQDEFYYSICNNVTLINFDNLYKMFTQIVKNNEEKLSPFLSNTRKAHMYLALDNFNIYKRICPVLPEILDD